MNEQTISDISTQALAMGAMNNPRFPPSPYYRFLERLAANIHPGLSVELGVCGGGGSFHLCQGWPDSIVVGVDVSYDYPENIAFIEKWYPDTFVFVRGDSLKVAPQIFAAYGEVDILFVDTVHTYEQTMAEYYAYKPYLSDKAVVCLDDLKREGMEEAWQEIPGRKVRLDILHPGSTEGGFGVIF